MCRTLLIFAFLFPCAVPVSAQSSESTRVDPTLARVLERFGRALDTGDSAGASEIFVENGVLLPPFGDVVRGRAGIAEAIETLLPGDASVRMTPVEAVATGATGVVIGVFNQPAGAGAKTVTRGKMLFLLRRTSVGTWQVTHAMWSVEAQ